MEEAAGGFGVFEGLFDSGVRIGAAGIARGVAEDRVLVVQGAATEFLNAAGMDAVELPVAVAADVPLLHAAGFCR